MRVITTAVVLLAYLCSPAQLRGQSPDPIQLGRLSIRVSGFFDLLGEWRSTSSQDTISTRFDRIALMGNGGESLWSLGHSRAATHLEIPLGPGKLAGYVEADFLTPRGQAPWRWRQYWGEYRMGRWRLMGGHAWSLLRPNRNGIASERDLFNTIVIEPAYHIGIAGMRRRQLRLTGEITESTRVAFEWESGGKYLAKVHHDRGRAHGEAVLFTGTRGRVGLSLAHVVDARRHLRVVGQEFVSKGGGPEELGMVPAGVKTIAFLEGIEAPLPCGFTAFGYGGWVHGRRVLAASNHTASQWTAGFHKQVYQDRYSTMFVSMQVSRAVRETWARQHGELNYWMVSVRYHFPRAN